jgi:hypothetical protein
MMGFCESDYEPPVSINTRKLFFFCEFALVRILRVCVVF